MSKPLSVKFVSDEKAAEQIHPFSDSDNNHNTEIIPPILPKAVVLILAAREGQPNCNEKKIIENCKIERHRKFPYNKWSAMMVITNKVELQSYEPFLNEREKQWVTHNKKEQSKRFIYLIEQHVMLRTAHDISANHVQKQQWNQIRKQKPNR